MKGQKGITLIALIITIIVMLILVAVTINVVINSGLFDQSKKAGSDYEQKAKDEAEMEDDDFQIKVNNETYKLNLDDKNFTGDKVTTTPSDGE